MNSPHSPRARRSLRPWLLAVLILPLTGCVGLWGDRQHHESSSVVQFLYPDRKQPFVQPTMPTLRLPLRVGVAFVPPGGAGDSGYRHLQPNFSEAQKADLLRKIADQFRAQPIIQSIELIPATYLRPGGGFDNLDQLRALLGIDVIALISYDQVQSSTETEAALAYWTIIGAYIVPGQRNATQTLMETAVFDIASRSLLFRAPGTSTVRNHTTLIRNDHELQQDSAQGITEASQQMTTALAQELERFKVRAREEPGLVRIEHKPGFTGAGALDAGVALLLLVLLGSAAARHALRASRPQPSRARRTLPR